jgi:putative membrane protein
MAGLIERLLGPFSQSPERLRQDLAATPLNAAKGFCMGSADIIPGVSGGTMALILGIYERLLQAIRSFDLPWLRAMLRLRPGEALPRNDLLFLLPLGLGIIAAIMFFTRVVPLPRYIVTHPELVYGLFFGLIAASIVVLMRQVQNFGFRDLLITLAGAAFGFAVVTLVPVATPSTPWFIFICGFIAISAMLLPGISGSFILLILGQYAFIIDALGRLDPVIIGAFCAGALGGLLCFSRAIGWLLKHFHRNTMLVIKGILIGSLWVVWPFQERVFESIGGENKLIAATPVIPETINGVVVGSFALMIAGFVLVLIISRLARGHGKGSQL